MLNARSFRRVDPWPARHDVAGPEPVVSSIRVGHDPTGLAHEERVGRAAMRREMQLPVAIEVPVGDVGEMITGVP